MNGKSVGQRIIEGLTEFLDSAMQGEQDDFSQTWAEMARRRQQGCRRTDGVIVPPTVREGDGMNETLALRLADIETSVSSIRAALRRGQPDGVLLAKAVVAVDEVAARLAAVAGMVQGATQKGE